jgi:glucokinase
VEQRFGGAIHRRNFASLVVSTDIGGALVLDGRLVHGRSGNAGHLGHLIAVSEGHECSCGSRGCLEAEVSGWALERDLGGSPHYADADTRRRVGKLVGRTAGSTLCVLDIDVCFVSGSVALGFGESFFESANRAAADVAKLSYCEFVTFVPSALGEDAPLLGAACVGGDS